MSRRFITTLLLVLALSGCAKDKTICGANIEPYGLFNPDDKDPTVKYRVNAFGVFMGIILIETVVVPLLVAGWFLYEPISPAGECKVGQK